MLHNDARSPEEVDLLSIRGLRKRPIICRLWDACQCAKTFLLGRVSKRLPGDRDELKPMSYRIFRGRRLRDLERNAESRIDIVVTRRITIYRTNL
jgi:hypothetical protein